LLCQPRWRAQLLSSCPSALSKKAVIDKPNIIAHKGEEMRFIFGGSIFVFRSLADLGGRFAAMIRDAFYFAGITGSRT
jgi:hypothetical protein